MQMIQPTVNVYKTKKNEKHVEAEDQHMHKDSSFECEHEEQGGFIKDEQDLKIRTKDLSEMVAANMENWEHKVLDLIGYDYSGYIL